MDELKKISLKLNLGDSNLKYELFQDKMIHSIFEGFLDNIFFLSIYSKNNLEVQKLELICILKNE